MPRLASVRVRTTLAATLAVAACLGSAGWWLREKVYADRFQLSVRQSASDAHRLGLAGGGPAFEGYPWLALGNAGEVRGSGGSGLTPGQVGAGIHRPRDGFTEVEVRLDGRPAILVAAEIWTGADGRPTEFPTYVSHPDKGVFVDPAVARTRVVYYLRVSPSEAEAAARAVDAAVVLVLLATVLVVGTATWLTGRRAMRPVEATVEALSDELAAITSAAPAGRVSVPDSGDELEGLAVTANAALGRLEKAAERQRRFIADAAHELRSPLAGLRSTVEVARAHAGTADLPATLDVVLAAARRLQDLTDDLLLLARLDDPGQPRDQPVDLAAIAEEQVAERRYRGAGPVEFTAHVDGPALVSGDQLQVERLVRNLMDNADRHARTAVKVTVSARDDEVVVEVADDGEGIAAADRERVFEPFTRLDEARARDSGGTGLGLAIVRDVAARHGARVDVSDGPGARFTVRFAARTPPPAHPG